MKAFQDFETEFTRLRLLEPQLLKRITALEAENKDLRSALLHLVTAEEQTRDGDFGPEQIEGLERAMDQARSLLPNNPAQTPEGRSPGSCL